MRIELVPDPGPDDAAARAAVAAVTREGFAADERPLQPSPAWRRAGICEAVERAPGPAGGTHAVRDVRAATPKGRVAASPSRG